MLQYYTNGNGSHMSKMIIALKTNSKIIKKYINKTFPDWTPKKYSWTPKTNRNQKKINTN